MKKRHGINNGYKRSDSLDGDSSKTGQFNVLEYQELLEKARQLRQNFDNPKSIPYQDKRREDQPPKSGEQDRKFTEFLSSLAQKRRPPSVSETGSSSSDSETVQSGLSFRDRNNIRDLGSTYDASKFAGKSDSGLAGQSSDLKHRDSRRNSLSTFRDYDSQLQNMVRQKLAPMEHPTIKIDETPKAARSKPVLKEKREFLIIKKTFFTGRGGRAV